MGFYVKFWGVRGSIPTPGWRTARFGGNTACVELNIDGNLFICDGGTGLHELGLDLVQRQDQPILGHLLFSHTHWDHIQGFPFFLPVYSSENTFYVYSPEQGENRLYRLLSGQMSSDYFPVDFHDLHAHIAPRVIPRDGIEIGGVKVTSIELTHRGICYGYAFEWQGHKVVYATDNELDLALTNADEARDDPDVLRRAPEHLVDFARDADLLVADGQYADAEYWLRVGWGHPRATTMVDLAIQAGVKILAVTHHDPLQSDDEVARKIDACQARATRFESPLLVFGAREGIELQID